MSSPPNELRRSKNVDQTTRTSDSLALNLELTTQGEEICRLGRWAMSQSGVAADLELTMNKATNRLA
jgi:hypothetical protein